MGDGGREQPINGKPVFIYGKENQTDTEGKAIKVDSEGNLILTGDVEIGAVENKDGTTDNRQSIKVDNATATATPTVALVGGIYKATEDTYDDNDASPLHTDSNGNLKVTGGASSVGAEYTSPSDFTATYTSTSTITLSSLPFTISDSSQLVYVKQILSGNTSVIYVNGSGGVTLSVSSNVLTVYKSGAAITALASGDAYEIGINSQKKAYDPSTQSNKASLLNPVYSRYTDVETLIAAAQELDATPTDLGAEIDMSGYNELGVWLTVDIGTSTDVTLRIIHKHTSAGAEEYREIYLGSPASNITTVNLNDYQVGADSDQLIKINIPVSMTSPYIQLQVSDAADGDGQIDACYITKAYAA